MRIGIIGYGSVGRSLARGFNEDADVVSIVATTRTPRSFQYGDRAVRVNSNPELVEISDVVLVAVKPWQVQAVLEEVAPHLIGPQVVISVASSVTMTQLRAWSGKTLCRVMPNLPCQIREGMSIIAHDETLSDVEIDIATKLFSTVGRVAVLDEDLMDAATAISGCGPAYAYIIIEALAEAGVKLGISRAMALEMVAQTFVGAARMVLETGTHPAALKDGITTPGGCTIDGLLALEDGNIRSTLVKAAVAAASRARDLRAV